MNINTIALAHNAWVEQMGWHNTTQLEKMALVASEVGEAVNELRGDEPTRQYAFELADIVLRVLDAAVEAGVDMEWALTTKMSMNRERGNKGRVK